MNEALRHFSDALMQHIPPDVAWMPSTAAAAALVFGLILLLKGAKLAPLMTGFVFLAAGGAGGAAVAGPFGFQPLPVILLGAGAGFIIGLALFRLWLSVMVAACFAVAALSFYGHNVLTPHLEKYVSEGPQAFSGEVRLPAAGEALTAGETTPAQELSQLWTYLNANVANLQPSLLAIVVSTAIAGIVFGFLVSRLARALWASSTGTVLAAAGAYGLATLFAPSAVQWLTANAPWAWGIVAAVWLLSLVHNLRDCGAKRTAKAGPVPQGTPATA